MSLPLGLARAKAQEIMEWLTRWERDQEQPPALREDVPHPGTNAVELARYVLGIPGPDPKTRRCPQIEPHEAHLWTHGPEGIVYRCNGLDEDTSGE